MGHNESRRTFLQGSLGMAAAGISFSSTVPRWLAQGEAGMTPSPGKLLILGGTRFLGPHLVREALAAGWEITLFNRGRSNPELFQDLETRIGDRNTSDYASLKEGQWDLVIDTSCYIPTHVTAAIEALKGRIGHYVVVSTLSVYSDEAGALGPVDESSLVGEVEADRLPEFKVIQDIGKFKMAYYGPLKALCESAAEAAMPGATTAVRPGLIVGPGDSSDRYTYWPVRIAEGGEILAPGKPSTQVPFIDVRDLAPFILNVGAAKAGGIFNAVGFDKPKSMKEVLDSCIVPESEGEAPTFTWVDDEFLLSKKLRPRADIPLWEPGGRFLYVNERAKKAGLTFTDLEETARATLAWHRETRKPDHRMRAGVSRKREAEMLKEWSTLKR